jgi:uncharacterized protein
MGVALPRPINTLTPQDVGLVYETHFVAISPESELETWLLPHPKPQGMVVLFPPYGASKAALLTVAKQFHQFGYSILLVDYRGVGGSTGNDTTLGVREAEDVKQAVIFARQQWKPRSLILYGASMGATAVMRAVAVPGSQTIAPDAVILESPFDSLLNTVRHRFTAMGVPSFLSAELIVFWGGVQHSINAFEHNPAEYAKAIHCPVSLLHGAADSRVTVQDATAIAQNLPNLQAFTVFPNAIGHGALVTENPTGWNQQVQQFLSSINAF